LRGDSGTARENVSPYFGDLTANQSLFVSCIFPPFGAIYDVTGESGKQSLLAEHRMATLSDT
jgi:hypothetical protein